MATQLVPSISTTPPRTWRTPERHLEAATDSPWYRLVSRLQCAIVDATSSFYKERRIRPTLMPITVGSISSPIGLGSDSLPVRIDLLGGSTYLADSMQFQLELLLRQGFEGVYYIMPSFRGEEPDATHLNQFFHSEAEIRGGLDEIMLLIESYVRRLAVATLAECEDDLVRATGTTRHAEDLAARSSFPRIRLRDALKLLGDTPEFFAAGPGDARSLTRRGEQALIRESGGVVWVTHFDPITVPFYQALEDDGEGARTADLLLGRGEAVGCGERHRTRAQVEAALKQHRVDPTEYEWYLRMKEHAPIRTAGFGLGLERFLLWLLRHDDARDLQVFPRIKGIRSWI